MSASNKMMSREVVTGQSAGQETIMERWQPIETAPRDGTRVDVWVVGYSDEPRRFTDAWFDGGHWWYSEDFADGPGVWSLDRNEINVFPSLVTHWMPLPSPPTE